MKTATQSTKQEDAALLDKLETLLDSLPSHFSPDNKSAIKDLATQYLSGKRTTDDFHRQLADLLTLPSTQNYDTGIWEGTATRGTTSIPLPSLDELLDGIAQKAKDILEAHGNRSIYPHVSIRPEDPPIVHDAQMILGYLHKLQELRRKDSIPDLALDHALRAGFWFAVSITRGGKELFAQRGKKSTKGSEKGSQKVKAAATKRQTPVLAEAKKIRQSTPKLSLRSAAELIARRRGGNFETIRKVIAPLWKKQKESALKENG